jgi:5-methyltetrahydropteroyltriglutamate--homocysteine methyltransferase
MITTTVVGSYPVPAWLRAFPNAEHLRDAMSVVVKAQELAGIDVVADGELGRFDVSHPDTNGMIDHFVRPLGGVQTALTIEQVDAWRSRAGMGYRSKPAGIVTGPISGGTLDLRSEWEAFRPLTDRRAKLTLTSPYMLAKVLADDHYGDLAALTLALADVLAEQVRGIPADIVQVDEANVTGSPHDADLAAAAINRVLAAVSGEKAVHLCFGNYGGQTIQKGSYDLLVGFLDALDADHVVLEVARRPDAELAALAETRPGLGLGIGVIDIKDNEVESPDEIARRIEAAAKVAGPERIRYVHPDCGLWMLQRSVADGKMRALVKGRDLYAGS